ncbi:MAG: glycosyltransferase family 4 protein [Planctomycetaceae bacterium]
MTDVLPRVLLLAGRFEVRGTTLYTLRLAERLPEYGIEPTIVCSDARHIDAARRRALNVYEFRNIDVPVIGRLVREWVLPVLHDRMPDLIHIQSRALLPLGIWLAGRVQRPFLVTVQDYPPAGQRIPFDHKLGRGVIAVSGSVRDAVLERLDIPRESVTVIHNGVVADRVSAERPVLDPAHIPVVGTAGPLEAVKGLPFFLAAAKTVNAARPNVEFLVAGGGPEERNLRRLSRELNIDRKITFVPNLTDFGQSLAAMDVFCLPSLQQGLGTVMLEAMALGKPVIATRVGGVAGVIRDRENGLLVPPSQSRPLANAILELLGDAVRARAIGEAGRSLVRREFRVETMVERTASLYHQFLPTTQPQPADAR